VEPNAKILILASLLHDIGKFMQRAGVALDDRYEKVQDVGEHGAHARGSAMYVARILRDPLIEDLVLYHHAPRSSKNPELAEIVSKADRISSAIDRRGRESGDTGQILKEPLKAIFPLIHLDSKAKNPSDYVYPLNPLEIGESAFPVRERDLRLWNLSDAYKGLWKQFERESEQLPRDPPVVTVMALLRKYTSVIPSAVYVNEPDVPLYDHAKTTAAIAHCLLEGEKDKPFLFVEANVSGIQKFIFSTVIPEQARKGTAKRLRGRSFWLSLLMDAMAREVVRECGLFEPAVLWNTGGHFLIVAPNTAKNRERIAVIDRKVNEHLLRKWKGLLAVTVATVAADDQEAGNFSSVLERLSVIGAGRKKQKFLDCGLKFEPEGEEEPLSHYCPVCGSRVAENGECGECALFLDLGTKLARAKFMKVGSDLPFSFSGLGLQAGYDLVQDVSQADTGEIIAINATGIKTGHPGGAGFIFIGNTVPKDGQEILTFNEMAQLAKGSPRLGYLKADVDNLGKIFATGLEKPLRTISRVHSLSSQLQFFFAGHINHLCDQFVVYNDLCPACMPGAQPVRVVPPPEEGEERTEKVYYEHPGPCGKCREKHAVSKFYITYSGGDDLLVIGPWDDTIRLADSLSQSFRRFTCDNPDITISAGIAVVQPRLPVARAVRQAEELLEQAKNTKGKARVAVFTECLPWREGTGECGLSSLIVTSKKLMEFVQSKAVPRNMIYSFLKLWEQSFADIDELPDEKQRKEALIQRKRYLPYLKYTLKRNIREEKDRRDIEELVVPIFPWIRLPVYITSLALRKDRGE